MAIRPASPRPAFAAMLLSLAAVVASGSTHALKKDEPARLPFVATVDAIADPAFPLEGRSYYFESSMDNIGTEDLEFREVARWLAYALGHPVASSRETADVLVRVSFGIGEPKTTRSTVVTAPGYSYPIGSYWYSAPPLTQTYVNTTYARHLLVEAYDLKTSDRLRQVWKTSIRSEGTNGDLRYVLPFMIAMAGNYFQKNAGHQGIQIFDDAGGRAIVDSWIGPPPAASPATSPAPTQTQTQTPTPTPSPIPAPAPTPAPPAPAAEPTVLP